MPTGLVPAGKNPTDASGPPETLKLAIPLLAESATYRNCPLGSTISPAAVAPAPNENGEPPSSVNPPLVPIAKAEMLPDAPFDTYKKPCVGEIAINCGFGAASEANANGDPATGLRSPRVVSILKTEIEAGTAGETEPWFSTNRNWPPEFTAAAIGLEHTPGLQTGVGESAVPMGVSTPAV